MKRRIGATAFLIFLLCLVTFSSVLSISASKSDADQPPKLSSCAAACIFDKTHGKILYMEDGDRILNTSTSAKVMMGLLACELLEGRLSETVTITEDMLSGASGYSMKLKTGEELSVADLLYGAICGSYNDAAYAIASVCADSSADFVALMNKKAAALGASATNYTNPLGYPDNDAMVTTLSDTLRIANAASENELYMEICSAKSYTVPATNLTAKRTVSNRNRLVYTPPNTSSVYFNPVCLGMNAGSSGESGGWSVITLARDEDVDLICIVLGGKEDDSGEIYAYAAANSLIEWACERYNTVRLLEEGENVGKAEVTMTSFGTSKVDRITSAPLDVYIPNGRGGDVELKVEHISSKLRAPIKAGEKIGAVIAYLDGERIGSCDILIAEDCEANVIMKVIDTLGGYTKSRAFIASAVFFVLVLPIALTVSKRRNSMHRRRKRRY